VDSRRPLPHLSHEQLLGTVSYRDAVDAMRSAFLRISEYSQLPREHVSVAESELLVMPAFGPGGLGVKLLTLNPENPARDIPLINGAYLLFAPQTLAVESTVDGAGLTALRTATVSALATDHLARPDAARLVVFGAGAQAAAHVAAMSAVRPIEHVTIVGTGSARTLALQASVRATGLACELGGPESVSDAEIVCTCTTSATALFRADLVAPGTHINAVGVYRSDARELEGAVLGAAQVVVETRAAALAEAGDVVMAIAEKWLTPDDLVELGDVVAGRVAAATPGASTVFKSVGLALEDLVLARLAHDRWAAAALAETAVPQ
jgi:ornithine cyclodeaminase/alanine dehydrogenase-like protein (mu-crystallin family)